MTLKKASVTSKKSKRENLGEQPTQQTTTKNKNCDAVVPNTVDDAKNTKTPSEDTKASSALRQVKFADVDRNSDIRSQDTKASSCDEGKTPSSEAEKTAELMRVLGQVDTFFKKDKFNKEDCKKAKQILQSGLFALLRDPKVDDDKNYTCIAEWLYAYKKVVNNMAPNDAILDFSEEWDACRKALPQQGLVEELSEAMGGQGKEVGKDLEASKQAGKQAEVDIESQVVQDHCQNFFKQAYGRCNRCFSSEEEEKKPLNDKDPVDVATKRSSFMHAVVLFEFEDLFTAAKTYPRFRSLTHFEWDAVAKALCYMFNRSVENTLARIATYLIFLQDEARICIEDDVEHGEWMIRLGRLLW